MNLARLRIPALAAGGTAAIEGVLRLLLHAPMGIHAIPAIALALVPIVLAAAVAGAVHAIILRGTDSRC